MKKEALYTSLRGQAIQKLTGPLTEDVMLPLMLFSPKSIKINWKVFEIYKFF